MDLLSGSNCCGLFFVPLRVDASFVEGLWKLELGCSASFPEGLGSLSLIRLVCEKTFARNDFTQKILSQDNLEPDVRLPVWQNTRSQST